MLSDRVASVSQWASSALVPAETGDSSQLALVGAAAPSHAGSRWTTGEAASLSGSGAAVEVGVLVVPTSNIGCGFAGAAGRDISPVCGKTPVSAVRPAPVSA